DFMKKKRKQWVKKFNPGLISRTLGIFVLLMLFGMHVYAEKDLPENSISNQEQKEITGQVTDDSNAPLPGVTITVEGTSRGVITDIDGNYKIDVKSTEKLVFSFIGMESQTIEVLDKTTINVQLQLKASELDDVTVVAFGRQKKESVLASVETIKPEELKVPSSNLTTALAGRVSGIISYQTSGEPGKDNAEFFVRGVTSFGYKKSPLILVDGVELTADDLARLQTDDIASFSIMKDATATALYGARGANGVILVTTKEGVEGKAKVSVRFENSFSSPTKEVDIADPLTYMQMHNEAVKTRGQTEALPYSYEKIAKSMDPNRNPYVYPLVDWKEMLFKDHTSNQRLNLNVSGGGKAARYYLAASYSRDNGVLNVDKRNNFNNNININRILLRSNININLTKTTEAIVRMHATFDDYNGPIDGGDGLYKKVMQSNPVLFPNYYAPDEANKYTEHILFGNDGLLGDYINPYADMVKGYKEYSRNLLLSQFELKQDLSFITEGLSARALANINRTSYFDVSRFYSPFYYRVGSYDKKEDVYTLEQLNPNQGSEALAYEEGPKLITAVSYFEGAINYSRLFADKHQVGALAVFTGREQKTANPGNLQSSLASRNMGVSGRVTYAYDSRYFGEFNFGYNGSERFSEDERFGFFPSAGLGWIVSNENFWGSLKKTISTLKFKGTYGLVGNDAIGSSDDRFFYLSNVNLRNSGRGYTFGTRFDYSKPGVSISRYANAEITWETAEMLNLGVELSFFDRLQVLVDWFSEYRTNILMDRSFIPSSMGLQSAVRANVGESSASGFDGSLDYNHSFSRDLWITARANFTYSKSKFEVYEEPDYQSIGVPWKSRVGQSLGQNWGYVAERLFIDQYEVENSPEQFGEYMAGDIKYKDINGDGRITPLDQVPIGNPTTPEMIYGFGSSMGYKGFDFSLFFQGMGNRSFWIDQVATAPFIDNADGVIGNNALLQAYADGAWLEERQNPYAIWPRLSEDIIVNNNQTSTWFMRDASFLRLKSVELGYSLPKRLIEPINLERFRVYCSGTNLFTFSEFDMWDVEMAGNGLGYPIQKVINFGVQVSF
uniref:SusC/RagA family TonB-linked outer membrane protein n=1 Tax=Mariniphaga sediminis TaxID=1628158 RepID=UPI003566B963